jgi:hypothetical protein
MVDARHATAKESTFGISDATLPRVVKIGCTHATPRFLTTGTAVCSRTSLARQQVDYKQLAAAISSCGFIHSVFGKVSE